MLVTFSTVGYGDVAPASWAGRVVASCAIFVSLTITAMPITIVGNNFERAWEQRERTMVVRQVQKTMVEQQMRAEDVITLFAALDESGSGAIGFVEFVSFLRTLGVPMRPGDSRRIFNIFDEHHNDEISYQEFCHVVFPDFVSAHTRDSHAARLPLLLAPIPRTSLSPRLAFFALCSQC